MKLSVGYFKKDSTNFCLIMKTLFLLFICGITEFLSAQSREFTLIVDTLGESVTSFHIETTPESLLKNPLKFNELNIKPIDQKNVESQRNNSNVFPNYISEKFIVLDSTVIVIPIDSIGSQLYIMNSNKCINDTIRISRLDYLFTDLTDTTFRSVFWYKVKGKNLVPIKRKTIENKIIKISIPNSVSKNKDNLILSINMETKIIPFEIDIGDYSLTISCGRIKRWWLIYPRRLSISDKTPNRVYKATLKL